jgi:hypothetical protein
VPPASGAPNAAAAMTVRADTRIGYTPGHLGTARSARRTRVVRRASRMPTPVPLHAACPRSASVAVVRCANRSSALDAKPHAPSASPTKPLAIASGGCPPAGCAAGPAIERYRGSTRTVANAMGVSGHGVERHSAAFSAASAGVASPIPLWSAPVLYRTSVWTVRSASTVSVNHRLRLLGTCRLTTGVESALNLFIRVSVGGVVQSSVPADSGQAFPSLLLEADHHATRRATSPAIVCTAATAAATRASPGGRCGCHRRRFDRWRGHRDGRDG